MTRKETLHNAEICVCGQREADYGSPEDNFRTIAEFWITYLKRKCVSEGADVCVEPEDVANMMALLKIGRTTTGVAKADNYVDGCGYLACAAEIATGPKKEKEEPQSIVQITAENLAKNICKKYDHDCLACPIGIQHNGRGVPCAVFRLNHPDEAIQIMRKTNKTKAEISTEEIRVMWSAHCARQDECSFCGLDEPSETAGIDCKDWVIQHKEKALEIMRKVGE